MYFEDHGIISLSRVGNNVVPRQNLAETIATREKAKGIGRAGVDIKISDTPREGNEVTKRSLRYDGEGADLDFSIAKLKTAAFWAKGRREPDGH